MTFARFALASFVHYRRTHIAVILGVAGSVAVLAGSLLVGASVRSSLEQIVTSRLGRTSVAAIAEQPFPADLSKRISAQTSSQVTSLLSLTGVVRHESTGHRANNVRVYGIDESFFAFHGVTAAAPGNSEILFSPDLARELGVAPDEAVVLRLARVTDIPLDSLHGRREETGRSIRLTSKGILSQDQLGGFSLSPGQGPARSVFVSLRRLQRDLGLDARVNTILTRSEQPQENQRVEAALRAVVTPSDLGFRFKPLPAEGSLVIDSITGLLTDDAVAGIQRAATTQARATTAVLTWLANRMTVGTNTVPYSLITAVGPEAAGDSRLAELLSQKLSDSPPIVLNEWAAKDLGAREGQLLQLEFYRWADEGRLVTDQASFVIAGVVPMTGLAVDQQLAPDYPGITTAGDLAQWDPPFPIDLKLVRKQDEDYWDKFHTAPKAFIPLAAGQSLWRTRHGQVTSVRVSGTDSLPLQGLADLTSAIRVVDVRSQNLSASAGATDFGAYFSYFSFFLMVSALLLSALFFRLTVEQRLPQIGVLRAAGYSVTAIRRVWLIEGGLVAAIGAALGVVLAIAWAKLMVFALTTWWVDAVGTTDLHLRIDGSALVIGGVSAALAAIGAISLTVRTLSRSSPRSQISGSLPAPRSRSRNLMGLGAILLTAAAALTVASARHVVPAVAGFFGAGALVLSGGLVTLGAQFRRRPRSGVGTIGSLSVRNASWRPGRSLTVAGLVASAVFLLISVDAFRKTTADAGSRTSGTGGFSLIAESDIPIVFDLTTPEGREAAGLRGTDGGTIYPLRLRPGDDTSCLNLYQPKQPRVLGIPARLGGEQRFTFARVVESADAAGRANPWLLLRQAAPGDPVPAIVDQTSLEYVLHASVGQLLTIDADTTRPITLQIVAALDDSVLQGEILIDEQAFQRLFPSVPGYRSFLIETGSGPSSRREEVAAALESSLEAYGFDTQSTVARLDAYHRVENTYLSTFQALGGLGLVLGCLGLVAVIARNVFERRREIALLGATGFTGRQLQQMVVREHVMLVGIGLAIGVVAALVALAPVFESRAGSAPMRALVWLAPVSLAGILAALGATRGLRRLPIVSSLRSE